MNMYTVLILITVCIAGSCILCFVSSRWQRTPTQQANLKAKWMAKRLPYLIVLAILLPAVANAQSDPCYDLYSVETVNEYFVIADAILGEDAPSDFNESLAALAGEGGPCYLKRSTNIIASMLGRGADWQAYRTGGTTKAAVPDGDMCRRLYDFTDTAEFVRYVGNVFANVDTSQGAAGTLWTMTMLDWSPCPDVAPDVVARNLGIVAEFDAIVGMMTGEEVAVVEDERKDTGINIANSVKDVESVGVTADTIMQLSMMELAILSVVFGLLAFVADRKYGLRSKLPWSRRAANPMVDDGDLDDGIQLSTVPHTYAQPIDNGKSPDIYGGMVSILDEYEIENETFEGNPLLPDLMNKEAMLIDQLFDIRWGVGFYFDMDRSVATDDFWMFALSETEFKAGDNLRRSAKDVQSHVSEIERHVSESRDGKGLPCKDVAVTVVQDGRLYLQLSRPDRQTINLSDISDDVLETLPKNSLYLGSGYIGTQRLPVTINLDDSDTWSAMIVGSSGSGKSVAAKIALILFLLRNDPADVDVYLAEHEPKNDLSYFARCAHVKGYARSKGGYLCMLNELTEQFKHIGDNQLPKRPTLLVTDEFPRFVSSDKQGLGELIKDELTAMGQRDRAFGYNPLFLSQSGRVDVFHGNIRTNIKVSVVGQNKDSVTTATNLGIDFDLSKLRGKGDFIINDGMDERRFKTPYIDILKDGSDPLSEDRLWIEDIISRWGENTGCTMHDQLTAKQASAAEERLTVTVDSQPQQQDNVLVEYWQNLVNSGVDIGKLWDFDQMWFRRGAKGKAIELATGGPKTNNTHYGKMIAESITWAINQGLINQSS